MFWKRKLQRSHSDHNMIMVSSNPLLLSKVKVSRLLTHAALFMLLVVALAVVCVKLGKDRFQEDVVALRCETIRVAENPVMRVSNFEVVENVANLETSTKKRRLQQFAFLFEDQPETTNNVVCSIL